MEIRDLIDQFWSFLKNLFKTALEHPTYLLRTPDNRENTQNSMIRLLEKPVNFMAGTVQFQGFMHEPNFRCHRIGDQTRSINFKLLKGTGNTL